VRGVGEVPIVPPPAALANAIDQADGVRMDELPMSPGRVTALLFTAGKFLIGLYLGSSSIGSAYGAAGSLAVFLVWVYYSAQILFLGAEFTQVYAARHGRPIVPKGNAVARSRLTQPRQAVAAGRPA
jgi:hypothetical protein